MIVDKQRSKGLFISKVVEGYDFDRACRASGFSRSTLNGWFKKDDKFKEKAYQVRREFLHCDIESIVINLAKGGTELVEESSTWIEEDESGVKVQRTRKVKKLPPSEKALAMLAKKYNKELVTTEININHEIGITIKDRALTMDERRSILELDRSEGAEVIEYTELV